MQIWRSPRLLLAVASLMACLGIVHGADKSPGEMANAATKFLAGLSPEQRAQAAFPFDGPERLSLAFHPDRNVPSKRADDRRDEPSRSGSSRMACSEPG